MIEVDEKQMRLGCFAQCVAIVLRMAMGNNFDFMLTVKPIGKDAEELKTVRILCDKKVNGQGDVS